MEVVQGTPPYGVALKPAAAFLPLHHTNRLLSKASSAPPCGVIDLSGYSCASNGVPFAVNQQYAIQGSTADGRPYYQGVSNTTAYLYFTNACGGLSYSGWVCRHSSVSPSHPLPSPSPDTHLTHPTMCVRVFARPP